MEPFGGGIDTCSGAIDHGKKTGYAQDKASDTYQTMSPHGSASWTTGPISSPNHQDVQIDHGRSDTKEVKNATDRNHTCAKIRELGRYRKSAQCTSGSSREQQTEEVQKDRNSAKYSTQDEPDGEIIGDAGCDESDRNQGYAHEPIANIVSENHAQIRLAEQVQDQHIAQCKEQ